MAVGQTPRPGVFQDPAVDHTNSQRSATATIFHVRVYAAQHTCRANASALDSSGSRQAHLRAERMDRADACTTQGELTDVVAELEW